MVEGSEAPRELLHRVQRSADRALGTLPSRVASALARDVSRAIATNRLLVLAPHPDDEALACGLTIQRALESEQEVTVVVATDGRFGDPEAVAPERMAEIRIDELYCATAVLGLPRSNLVLLGFEDASLSRTEDRLGDALRRVVETTRPGVVISPCPWDLHPDHAALGRAARRVLAGRSVQHLEYLVWGWDQPVRLAARLVRRARTTRGHWKTPRRPVVVNGTGYMTKKAEALACYSSQFSPTAVFHGQSIGGSGPLGGDFLRLLDDERELFFPTSVVPV
jgi:LmbE family N-acetylglucosaminyl deacetylase